MNENENTTEVILPLMKMSPRTETYGMRRRCFWCAVTLRAWQLNACRVCHFFMKYDQPSAPCQAFSRLHAEPDRWFNPFTWQLSYPTTEWLRGEDVRRKVSRKNWNDTRPMEATAEE